jgi:hypothetical protein
MHDGRSYSAIQSVGNESETRRETRESEVEDNFDFQQTSPPSYPLPSLALSMGKEGIPISTPFPVLKNKKKRTQTKHENPTQPEKGSQREFELAFSTPTHAHPHPTSQKPSNPTKRETESTIHIDSPRGSNGSAATALFIPKQIDLVFFCFYPLA